MRRTKKAQLLSSGTQGGGNMRQMTLTVSGVICYGGAGITEIGLLNRM